MPPTTEGERLRDEGIEQVETNNVAFVDVMRRLAIEHARTYGFVSADDMRPIASRLGLMPTHPNAWGAVFRDDRFTVLGYKQSTTASRHGGLLRVWKLADD